MFDEYFGNNVSGAEMYAFYLDMGLSTIQHMADQLEADYRELYGDEALNDVDFYAIAEEIHEDYKQLFVI